MNVLWHRFLKSAYRKEPISSFILIMGAVDAVIGGLGGRWTLLSLGTLMVLLAVLIRWWQSQKERSILVQDTPRYFLPPSSSNTPIPLLTSQKHRK